MEKTIANDSEQQVPEKKRTVIYIDGPNLNGAQSELFIALDFLGLRNLLSGDDEVVDLKYFCQPSQGSNFQGFLGHLKAMGYQTKTSQEGEDVDPYISKAINRTKAQNVDRLILVSGDGGYTNSLRSAKARGIKIVVAASKISLNPALTTVADEIILLDEHIEQIIDREKTARQQRKAKAELENNTSKPSPCLALAAENTFSLTITSSSPIVVERANGELVIRIPI